eukprot:TRINITY_DN383_c0_g2_i3.p1 TRINITY_DN383_c0_g2~~TRINITY_DN383_c0_g2_i3.p1  ORF type:complete len:710 (-),score=197.97 TRINITY_DN383_c0_g2_i3:61-2190(-)
MDPNANYDSFSLPSSGSVGPPVTTGIPPPPMGYGFPPPPPPPPAPMAVPPPPMGYGFPPPPPPPPAPMAVPPPPMGYGFPPPPPPPSAPMAVPPPPMGYGFPPPPAPMVVPPVPAPSSSSASSSLSVDFPSRKSLYSGPSKTSKELGAHHDSGDRFWKEDDRIDETFAATPGAIIKSIHWKFSMSDHVSSAFICSFDFEVNGSVVDNVQYQCRPDVEGYAQCIDKVTTCAIPVPSDGQLKLSIVSKNTVPSGEGSWTWEAGGNVTIELEGSSTPMSVPVSSPPVAFVPSGVPPPPMGYGYPPAPPAPAPSMVPSGVPSASTIVEFPSEKSQYSGPSKSTKTLGEHYSSTSRFWKTDDKIVESFTLSPGARVRSVSWDFEVLDHLSGSFDCSFGLLVNDIEIDRFDFHSTGSGSGYSHRCQKTSSCDVSTVGGSGEVRLSIVSKSTVSPGGGSWTWKPGGKTSIMTVPSSTSSAPTPPMSVPVSSPPVAFVPSGVPPPPMGYGYPPGHSPSLPFGGPPPASSLFTRHDPTKMYYSPFPCAPLPTPISRSSVVLSYPSDTSLVISSSRKSSTPTLSECAASSSQFYHKGDRVKQTFTDVPLSHVTRVEYALSMVDDVSRGDECHFAISMNSREVHRYHFVGGGGKSSIPIAGSFDCDIEIVGGRLEITTKATGDVISGHGSWRWGADGKFTLHGTAGGTSEGKMDFSSNAN